MREYVGSLITQSANGRNGQVERLVFIRQILRAR